MHRSHQPVGRSPVVALLWLAIACGVAYLVFLFVTRPFVPPDELWALNSHGVGCMEQFDDGGGFPKAVETFEEIVRRWPKWMPGKFNLAVAILNNQPTPENLQRSRKLLQEVLAQDDNDVRAHYAMGFILWYETKMDEALPHFEKLCSRLAPNDAMSWMRLGDCVEALGQPSAVGVTKDGKPVTPIQCYERAMELNPNMPAALYKVSMALQRSGDTEGAAQMRERFTQLTQSLHDPYTNDYIWSGPLAEVIGLKLPPPRPNERPLPVYAIAPGAKFELADGVRWSTAEDFQATSHGGLLARVRDRLGAGASAFDLDKDGDLDLFAPASVVADDHLRDTLFRNDGRGKFVDVTVEVGLSDSRESIGCAVGDFDADGFSDLYIIAVGGNHLFRNAAGSKFEDVTESAGVAQPETLSVGAAFFDVDHDSDLDLIVAAYGPLADADQMFRETPYAGGSASALFHNVGKSRTIEEASSEQPPLEIRFERAAGSDGPWDREAATVGFAAADFDNDGDLDLVEINDGSACRLLVNRRLGQWTAEELPSDRIPPARYNGGLVGDFNSDYRIDLMLVTPDGPVVYLQNELVAGQFDQPPAFKSLATDLRDLRSAQLLDADFDGWLDVVSVSAHANPAEIVLGSNRSRGMLARPEWLSGLLDATKPVAGMIAADFTGGGWHHLLVLHDGQPPKLLETTGNGNQWLALQTIGHRKVAGYNRKHPRSNPDGIGTRVMVHSGPNTVVWEHTTTTTGPCQSLRPIPIGLGTRTRADTVRLRWSDGLEQAELNVPAGQIIAVDETKRRGDSCPLLFAWNGRRFEFVTDFLGGGGIGYLVAPGVYSEPDPDEDVFIDSRKLVPDERGQLILKIAEPMDEMTYLDAAWLDVVDHPAGTTVYPDERFDPESAHPAGGRLMFRDRIPPREARDHRGNDVRQQLAESDRNTVDDFDRSAVWIGYADDHFIELDFERSFAGLKENEPLALFLAGWVEYPYSGTNWAAATAGVEMKPPVLKWLNEHGQWERLVANMGYPAGLPRMMTLDLTGKLPAVVRGESGHEPLPLRMRIETNMEIYWDEIFAARLLPTSPMRPTLLKPAQADLSYRGYLQEYTPDGREPKLFDYHQIISVPLIGLEGARTPYGDVREHLLDADERFALINAGDAVTLVFDSGELPPLRTGWTRSYILRTFGYCKASELFTRTGRTVEPLPSRKR
jgi:hypothetical protein